MPIPPEVASDLASKYPNMDWKPLIKNFNKQQFMQLLKDIPISEKIADIKTGGTVSFVQQNNLCYFLVNDPNAKLVCLDVLTGRIVDEVLLGGKNTHSPLQLVGNQLHTVTFYFKNRILQKAIWHCVTISDEGGMLK